MAAFNLTAQLNLVGPTNVRQVVADIRRQIGTIQGNVDLGIDPKTTRTIAQINAQATDLNRSLADTGRSGRDSASSLNQLNKAAAGGNIRSMAQSSASASKAIKDLGDTSRKSAKSAKILGNELAEFGRQSGLAIRRFAAFSLVSGVMYKLNSAVNQALSQFIDFDREVVRLSQVTGKSVGDLGSLTKEISRLSTATGVASEDLIKISSTLAQAGLSARDTEKALQALALSANAPSFDNLNNTVEGSIALMRQFGISTRDLEKALGSINAVSAAFAVEAGDIISAISRTGGVFASASKGVSQGIDALNEFIAVFTSVRATTRESAETIATGLRTIFTRIQRSSTVEALQELGVQLRDVEGKFVGPYEAVRRLSEGLGQLDPRSEAFAAIVEELGGFRQIGKVIPLIQQFATAEAALNVAMQGGDSLAEANRKAQQSLAVQLAKTREEFVALIRDFANNTVFRSFLTNTIGLTKGLLGLARAGKALFPLLTIIGGFKAISGITQFAGGFAQGVRPSGGKGGGAKGIGQGVGEALTGAKSERQAAALEKIVGMMQSNVSAFSSDMGALAQPITALSSNIQQNIISLNDNTSALNASTAAINALISAINNRGGSATLYGGGRVLGFNRGGVVPGSGKGDSVPALLEPGEVVMSNRAVSKYGRGNLVRMNKYAKGGPVPLKNLPSQKDISKGYDNNRIEPEDNVTANLNRMQFDFDENTASTTTAPINWVKLAKNIHNKYKGNPKKIFFETQGEAFEESVAEYLALDSTKALTSSSQNDRYYPIDIIAGNKLGEVKFTEKIFDDAYYLSKLTRHLIRQKELHKKSFTNIVDVNPPVDLGSLDIYEMAKGAKKKFSSWYSTKDKNNKFPYELFAGGKIQRFIDGGWVKRMQSYPTKQLNDELKRLYFLLDLYDIGEGPFSAKTFDGNKTEDIGKREAQKRIKAIDEHLTARREKDKQRFSSRRGPGLQPTEQYDTQEMLDAITYYQAGSGPFTKALAAGKKTFKDPRGERYKTQDIKDRLLSASQFQIPKKTYSGLGRSQLREILSDTGVTPKQLSSKPSEVLKTLVGKNIDFPTFLSVSTMKAQAEPFVQNPGALLSIDGSSTSQKTIDVIKAKNKTAKATTESKSRRLPGLDKISSNKLDSYDEEKEFIIPPNVGFRITKATGKVSSDFSRDLKDKKLKEENYLAPQMYFDEDDNYFEKTKLNLEAQMLRSGGLIQKFMSGSAGGVKPKPEPFGTGATKFPRRISNAYAKQREKEETARRFDKLIQTSPINERIMVDQDMEQQIAESMQQPLDREQFVASFKRAVLRDEIVSNISNFAKFVGLPSEDLSAVLPRQLDFGSGSGPIGSRGGRDLLGGAFTTIDPYGSRGAEGWDLSEFGYTKQDEQDLFGFEKLLEEKKKEREKIRKTPTRTFDDGSTSFDLQAYDKASDEYNALNKQIYDIRTKRDAAISAANKAREKEVASSGRATLGFGTRFGKAQNPVFYHELTHQLFKGLRAKSADSFDKYKQRVTTLFETDNDGLVDAFDALNAGYSSADVVYGRAYKLDLLGYKQREEIKKDPAGEEAKNLSSLIKSGNDAKKATQFRPINPSFNEAMLKFYSQEHLDKVEDNGKEEFLTTLVEKMPVLDQRLQGILDSTMTELLGGAGIQRQKYATGGYVQRFGDGGTTKPQREIFSSSPSPMLKAILAEIAEKPIRKESSFKSYQEELTSVLNRAYQGILMGGTKPTEEKITRDSIVSMYDQHSGSGEYVDVTVGALEDDLKYITGGDAEKGSLKKRKGVEVGDMLDVIRSYQALGLDYTLNTALATGRTNETLGEFQGEDLSEVYKKAGLDKVKISTFVKQMDAAAQFKFPEKLYSGLGDSKLDLILKDTNTKNQKDLDSLVGKTFTMPSFLSASDAEGLAASFARVGMLTILTNPKRKGIIPQKSKATTINRETQDERSKKLRILQAATGQKGFAGLDIDEFYADAYDSEGEYIFPSNSKFKINSIEKNTAKLFDKDAGYRHLDMEVQQLAKGGFVQQFVDGGWVERMKKQPKSVLESALQKMQSAAMFADDTGAYVPSFNETGSLSEAVSPKELKERFQALSMFLTGKDPLGGRAGAGRKRQSKFALKDAGGYNQQELLDAVLYYQGGSGPLARAMVHGDYIFVDREEAYDTEDVVNRLKASAQYQAPKKLYSGLGRGQYREVLKDAKIHESDLANNPDQALAKLQGQTIDFPTFLSTSTLQKVAKTFIGDPGAFMSIDASQSEQKVLDILKAKKTSTKDVTEKGSRRLPGIDKLSDVKLSGYDLEKEFVLPPSIKFRINSAKIMKQVAKKVDDEGLAQEEYYAQLFDQPPQKPFEYDLSNLANIEFGEGSEDFDKPATTSLGTVSYDLPKLDLKAQMLARGGAIQRLMEGGVAQRKLGYIDYDVIANPANEAVVAKGMEATGVKGPRLYTDHLTQLAIQARKDSNLQKLRAVYGVAGSGKTTLARGQGTDKGKLRETTRFPILTPEDIQRASEVIILSSTVSKDKLDDIFSFTDRTYTLSSTTPEEKAIIKAQIAGRDVTGIGAEGRAPGSTTGAPKDTAVGEALLKDRLGDRSVVLGRTESGRLRRKRGDELVEVIKKIIGFTWGGYSPMTAGHESIMDAAAAMGIPPEDFIYLIGSNEGIIPGKEDSYRTAIFDQDTRMILAQAGAGAKGATVLRKPRDFETPPAFDISEPGQRRRVIVPAKGSTTFVADKTPEQTEKYKKAGYKVQNIERTGGISGTMVRKLIQDGNLGELQKVLSPGVYDLISNNIGRIQNRANIIPSLIQQTQQTQGVELADIEKQIKAVGITKIVKSKLDDPEYAAKVQVLTQLREQRDKIKKSVPFEPHRLLAALAAKEPEKYGLDLSTPVSATAAPIRTVSQTTPAMSVAATTAAVESAAQPPIEIPPELTQYGKIGMEAIPAIKAGTPIEDAVQARLAEVLKDLGGAAGIRDLGVDIPLDLKTKLRLDNLRSGKLKLKPVADVLNRAQEAKAAKGAAEAAEKLRREGVRKVALAGLQPLNYSRDPEWELSDGRKYIALTRGFQSVYLQDIERFRTRQKEAALEFAKDTTATEAIGFLGQDKAPVALRPLAIDFDDTLAFGTKMLNAEGKEDISAYYDEARVREVLSKATPTRLAERLAEIESKKPGTVRAYTRVLTARAESLKHLVTETLNRFGLPYTDGDITGVGQKGDNDRAIARKKGDNLSQIERFIDDSEKNIASAQTKGIDTYRYVEPKAFANASDYEPFGAGNIEGALLEQALAMKIGRKIDFEALEQNRALDFPGGLGAGASLFGLPPNIETEIKRTLDKNSFAKARSEFDRYFTENPGKYNIGGLVSKFVDGGSVPALVSNGEAYVPPKLAKKIGYGTLNRMNQADRNGMGRFSQGGISVFKGPGSGTSDSIPTRLPVGSFIIREKATKALGFNRGGAVGIRRFANGGGPAPLSAEDIRQIVGRGSTTANIPTKDLDLLRRVAGNSAKEIEQFSFALEEAKKAAIEKARSEGKSSAEIALASREAVFALGGLEDFRSVGEDPNDIARSLEASTSRVRSNVQERQEILSDPAVIKALEANKADEAKLELGAESFDYGLRRSGLTMAVTGDPTENTKAALASARVLKDVVGATIQRRQQEKADATASQEFKVPKIDAPTNLMEIDRVNNQLKEAETQSTNYAKALRDQANEIRKQKETVVDPGVLAAIEAKAQSLEDKATQADAAYKDLANSTRESVDVFDGDYQTAIETMKTQAKAAAKATKAVEEAMVQRAKQIATDQPDLSVEEISQQISTEKTGIVAEARAREQQALEEFGASRSAVDEMAGSQTASSKILAESEAEAKARAEAERQKQDAENEAVRRGQAAAANLTQGRFETDEDFKTRQEQESKVRAEQARRSSSSTRFVSSREQAYNKKMAQQSEAEAKLEDKKIESQSRDIADKSTLLLIQALNENTKSHGVNSDSLAKLESATSDLANESSAAATARTEKLTQESEDLQKKKASETTDADNNEVVLPALDMLEGLGDRFNKFGDNIANSSIAVNGEMTKFARGIQSGSRAVSNALYNISDGIKQANTAFANTGFGKFAGAFGKYGTQIGAGVTMATQYLSDLAGNFDSTSGTVLQFTSTIAAQATTMGTLGAQFGVLGGVIGTVIGAAIGFIDSLNAMTDAARQRAIADLESAKEVSLQDARASLELGLNGGANAAEDFTASIGSMSQLIQTENALLQQNIDAAPKKDTSIAGFFGFGSGPQTWKTGEDLRKSSREMAAGRAGSAGLSSQMLNSIIRQGNMSLDQAKDRLGPQGYDAIASNIALGDSAFTEAKIKAAQELEAGTIGQQEYTDKIYAARDAAVKRATASAQAAQADEEYRKTVTEVRKRLESQGGQFIEDVIRATPKERGEMRKNLVSAEGVLRGDFTASRAQQAAAAEKAYRETRGTVREKREAAEQAKADVRGQNMAMAEKILSFGDQSDQNIRNARADMYESMLREQGIDPTQGMAAEVIGSLREKDPELDARDKNTEALLNNQAAIKALTEAMKNAKGGNLLEDTTFGGAGREADEADQAARRNYTYLGGAAVVGTAALAGADQMFNQGRVTRNIGNRARNIGGRINRFAGGEATPDVETPARKPRIDPRTGEVVGGGATPKPRVESGSAPTSRGRSGGGTSRSRGGGRASRRGIVGVATAGIGIVAAGAGYLMGGGGEEAAGSEVGMADNSQVVALLGAIEKNTRCACTGGGGQQGGGMMSIPPEVVGGIDAAINQTLSNASLTAQQQNIDVGMGISESLANQGIDTSSGLAGAAIADIMSSPETVSQEQLGNARADIVAGELANQGIDINTDAAQMALDAIATSTDPAMTSFSNLASVSDALAVQLANTAAVAQVSADAQVASANVADTTSKETRNGWLDGIQTVLDFAGLIPLVGEIADGANAAIYSLRAAASSDPEVQKDLMVDAGLSAAAMIPVAGYAANAAKFTKTGARAIAGGARALGRGGRSLAKGAINEVADQAIMYAAEPTITGVVEGTMGTADSSIPKPVAPVMRTTMALQQGVAGPLGVDIAAVAPDKQTRSKQEEAKAKQAMSGSGVIDILNKIYNVLKSSRGQAATATNNTQMIDSIIKAAPSARSAMKEGMTAAQGLLKGDFTASRSQQTAAGEKAYRDTQGTEREKREAAEQAKANVRQQHFAAAEQILSLGDPNDANVRNAKANLRESMLKEQGIDPTQGMAAEVIASIRQGVGEVGAVSGQTQQGAMASGLAQQGSSAVSMMAQALSQPIPTKPDAASATVGNISTLSAGQAAATPTVPYIVDQAENKIPVLGDAGSGAAVTSSPLTRRIAKMDEQEFGVSYDAKQAAAVQATETKIPDLAGSMMGDVLADLKAKSGIESVAEGNARAKAQKEEAARLGEDTDAIRQSRVSSVATYGLTEKEQNLVKSKQLLEDQKKKAEARGDTDEAAALQKQIDDRQKDLETSRKAGAKGVGGNPMLDVQLYEKARREAQTSNITTEDVDAYRASQNQTPAQELATTANTAAVTQDALGVNLIPEANGAVKSSAIDKAMAEKQNQCCCCPEQATPEIQRNQQNLQETMSAAPQFLDKVAQSDTLAQAVSGEIPGAITKPKEDRDMQGNLYGNIAVAASRAMGVNLPASQITQAANGVINTVSSTTRGPAPEATNAVSGLSQLFDTAALGETLQKSFGDFLANLQNIQLPKIPDVVTMEGRHTVEVIINGAEALKSIEPMIVELIDTKLGELKNNINNITEGGFGP